MTVIDISGLIKSKLSVEEVYRTHHLKSSYADDLCIGEVHKNGARIAYCESSTIESSQQHLRRIVDWQIKEEIKKRNNREPSRREWIEAVLSTLQDCDSHEKDLLYKLASLENGACSSQILARVAKLNSGVDVYFALANFSRKTCDAIPYEPPSHGDGRDSYFSVICKPSSNTDNVELTSVFYTILSEYWKK